MREKRIRTDFRPVQLRTSTYQRFKVLANSSDNTLAGYLDKISLILAEGKQGELVARKPKELVLDGLAALNERLDLIETKLNNLDSKTWGAFLQSQKQVLGLSIMCGMTADVLDKVVPGSKALIEAQGRVQTERDWTTHLRGVRG